jgi:hypothetical protein
MEPHDLKRQGVRRLEAVNPCFGGDGANTVVVEFTLRQVYDDDSLNDVAVPLGEGMPWRDMQARIQQVNAGLDELYDD